MQYGDRGAPPTPAGVASFDDLAARLQDLRAWSGLSYRALHREVVRSRRERHVVELPAFDTVHRCLQPGRARLDVELVVDLAAAMLGDRDLAASWRQAFGVAARTLDAAGLVTVSDELPEDDPGFTGRTAELRTVLEAGQHDGVVAITGMGGVGKTRLAVHAAHELRRELVLVADLRGYDADLPPADPAAVADALLRRLGVPGPQVARLDLPGRRSRLSRALRGRKALLLLDDASGAEQVTPLVPDGCLVLVTSRATMGGVADVEVPLDVYDPVEATTALARAAAPVPVDARDPDAARVTDLVGRLPLAVALLGGRIREADGWTLADHADRLEEARHSRHLDDGVEVALRLSYDRLGEDARRLLRLIGLHPGRDLDLNAAAALAGVRLEDAERTLATLTTASVVRQEAGRWSLHDLVRTFAAHHAHEEEPATARREAVGRLLDLYDATAARAAALFAPQTALDVPEPPPTPSTPVPDLADREDARRWLDAEWASLVGAALRHGELRPGYVVRLSVHLQRYLDVTGRTDEALALHSRAASLAEGEARARALVNVANVHFPLGRHERAEAPLREALPIYRASGNRASESIAVNNLGLVHLHAGRLDEAREAFEEALALAPEPVNRLFPLGNLTQLAARVGRDEEALAHARNALEVATVLGDPTRRAQTLYSVGNQLRAMGRPDEAEESLTESLRLAREADFPYCEAYALGALGRVRLAQDRPDEAVAFLEEAVGVARAFGIAAVEADATERLREARGQSRA